MVTLLQSGRVGRSTTERLGSQRSSASSRHQHRLDRCAELADGHWALELRLDATVASDEERPRLALQLPLPHPAVVALCGIVALEHLDVDEAYAAAGDLLAHVRDDIDDRAARPARAELRRRESHDEGLVRGERLGNGRRVEL